MLSRDTSLATCHRTYLITTGDAFSARKAVEFEERLAERQHDRPANPLRQRAGNIQQGQQKEALGDPPYTILTLPRARRVHQSLLTAPFTTLSCLCA
ncbi:UDP-N-acetylglucosamine transferase subunit, partial [Ascosphaera atra]